MKIAFILNPLRLSLSHTHFTSLLFICLFYFIFLYFFLYFFVFWFGFGLFFFSISIPFPLLFCVQFPLCLRSDRADFLRERSD